MTGESLVSLVARALSRRPTTQELADWDAVLERIPDDDADQALIAHRAASTYPATPADVRRQATAIANDRAMRAEVELRRRERETGLTADGQPLVPMPEQVRQATAELATRQRVRDAALQPDDPSTAGTERATPAPTWPCCPHCTGTNDAIGHPPHQLPCDLCPAAIDEPTREQVST